MKSPRQDKEPVGLGASVIVAIAGVVVAALGLVTMRSAFPPMPKADTPMVVTHPDPPLVSAAYHAQASAPAVLPRHEPRAGHALSVEPPGPVRPRTIRVRQRASEPPEIPPDESRAVLEPTPSPAAAPEKVAAVAAPDDGKLCMAPSPNEVTSKALQPGLILRYDMKFKASVVDIPPQAFPPQEQRRLKLSALLADILSN